jgi:vacuolar-type H+-ATPase subunit E/Vma4
MKTVINDVIDKKNVVLDRIKSNADARTQKITDSIVAAIENDLAKQS